MTLTSQRQLTAHRSLRRLRRGPRLGAALKVEVDGALDGDARGARLLVGPAVLLQLVLPLPVDEDPLRPRLRHVVRLRAVGEVLAAAVVGRHLPAGREL